MLIYVIITNKESDEMKQLNIEVVLINNNQISKGKYFAIKDDNSISYIDNNVKVYLYFKDMVRITRENDEYFLDFNFVKDQVTKGKYILNTYLDFKEQLSKFGGTINDDFLEFYKNHIQKTEFLP